MLRDRFADPWMKGSEDERECACCILPAHRALNPEIVAMEDEIAREIAEEEGYEVEDEESGESVMLNREPNLDEMCDEYPEAA